MKIVDKNKFAKRIFTLILIIIILIICIMVKNAKSNQEKLKQDDQIQTSTSEQIKQEDEEIIEKASQKINFLANVDTPLYKKDEKNIKIPVLIYHAFRTPIPEEDIYKLFSSEENFEENVTTLLDDRLYLYYI